MASSANSMQSTVMSPQDAKVMASETLSSSDSDLSNVLSASFFAGQINGFQFAHVGLGMLAFSAINNCVTKNVVSDTANNIDVIFTFKCPNVNGTYEFKAMNSAANGSSYEVINNLVFSDNAGDSVSTNSDSSIAKSAASVITINKKYDDVIKIGANSLERKGNASIVYTPDNANMPFMGGIVQISGSFDTIKNGMDAGAVTVSSKNLHRAICGFDSGSLEIKNAANDFVITFSGCGKVSVTDNGQAVMLP